MNDFSGSVSIIEEVLLCLIGDSSKSIQAMLATRIGPLIGVIGGSVSPVIVRHYTQFLMSHDSDTACSSAFCFPAVVLAIGPDRYTSELSDFFRACLVESEVRTRRSLACGLVSCAHLVNRDELYDIVSELLKDVSEVMIGVLSNLSDLVELVDDRATLLFGLTNPTGRFADWRGRLRLSEQIRKCAQYFDRNELFESAMELIEDEVAVVRADAAVSLGRLARVKDIELIRAAAENESHWTRLSIAKAFQYMDVQVAIAGRDVLDRLLMDPVLAVKSNAEQAERLISALMS
jgi:hypothetical protein